MSGAIALPVSRASAAARATGADAARRAVLDSSPLPLPKGKEKKFQNILMDFNTSFINDY